MRLYRVHEHACCTSKNEPGYITYRNTYVCLSREITLAQSIVLTAWANCRLHARKGSNNRGWLSLRSPA